LQIKGIKRTGKKRNRVFFGDDEATDVEVISDT
jgi:hypothetical protein